MESMPPNLGHPFQRKVICGRHKHPETYFWR
jgi:hypothetical protein